MDQSIEIQWVNKHTIIIHDVKKNYQQLNIREFIRHPSISNQMHRARQSLCNSCKINTLESPEISGFITKNNRDETNRDYQLKLTKEGVYVIATPLPDIK